ncbi:hypothetical protein GRAN_1318 [Granulicella sibirica]|uniref:Uncharacterized protein n=1 Tax=Granulicella sibirica TaxID=2479048 RepID=A0A4Q0T7C3_9BACT|nr:hypothetical protein GRAN_1318 [Granulicella sibirica]
MKQHWRELRRSLSLRRSRAEHISQPDGARINLPRRKFKHASDIGTDGSHALRFESLPDFDDPHAPIQAYDVDGEAHSDGVDT